MLSSILCSTPVPPAAKNPNNMMLPPLYFTVVNFSLIRPQNMSPKIKVLSLGAFAKCNLALILLLEYCFLPLWVAFRHRTHFSVDNDTVLPASVSISTRSFVLTQILHQNTSISGRQNPLNCMFMLTQTFSNRLL
ncbi:hypothetical protein CHARACLAT_028946 [Characodon lateralis]|uniref:Uncharacterized protein n=1 Tax=Characodon lateralis TaxID=208331 RepID=A0ABU7EEE0_9TELE|nr:hypothetical protein [Characodon lateralis]